MVASSLLLHKDVGHSQAGRHELKKIFDDKGYFDGPKPVKLLLHLLKLANTSLNDIVLDFFSGSATMAQAVMEMNAEDGCRRKFIMVQLPELIDEKSDAYAAGYKNICEIGKERIRRAGKKTKSASATGVVLEMGLDLLSTMAKIPETENLADMDTALKCHEELDTGFKVFKLDTSNLKKWNNEYTRDYDDLANRIREHYDYLTPDRTPLEMVYEIMLKYSLPLTLPVAEVTVTGATAHIITHEADENVDMYKVLVCMQLAAVIAYFFRRNVAQVALAAIHAFPVV